MEIPLVKNYYLKYKLLEIKNLVDLNKFRTAPQLNDGQFKKLREELEDNIFCNTHKPCQIQWSNNKNDYRFLQKETM